MTTTRRRHPSDRHPSDRHPGDRWGASHAADTAEPSPAMIRQRLLVDELDELLDADEPVDFLRVAATFVEIVDHRRLGRDDILDAVPDQPAGVLATFLVAVAELTANDILRARLRRDTRDLLPALPLWLALLRRARVVAATTAGREEEQVHLVVELAGGYRVTVAVWLQHERGGAVQHVRLDDGDPADVGGRWPRVPVDLADAGRRVALALANTPIGPSGERGSSLASLARWAARLAEQRAAPRRAVDAGALVDAALSSPFGAEVHDDEGRAALAALASWAADRSDPLAWDPGRAAWALHWAQNAPLDNAVAVRVPAALRALVRHAGHERAVRRERVTATLGAVHALELRFREQRRQRRDPRLVRALLDRPDLHHDLSRLDRLAFGLDAAPASLSLEPLPDEPFPLDDVPAPLRGRVGDVLAHVDAFTATLGAEVRTASRRLLRRLVEAEPGLLRRATAAREHAALVVWLVVAANTAAFSRPGDPQLDGVRVGDLAAMASASFEQRARAALAALGIDHDAWRRGRSLWSTGLLTSGTRGAIAATWHECVGRLEAGVAACEAAAP